MKNAVFPGSFDPFTVGHLDILKRACEIFDYVTVCVIPNPAKHYLFGDEERVMLINRVIEAEGIKNAAADSFSGLTVECARKHDAGFIVRGLRSYDDYEFETNMEYFNKRLAPEVQTVYLACDAAHVHISSSAVRELMKYGADIGALVPNEISEYILGRVEKNEQ